jgi:uncharacterized protein (DUF433 family)
VTNDRIISDVMEAIENIRRFNRADPHKPFRTILAYARNWYAMKGDDGEWLFAPAKFIGYVADIAEVLETEDRDGRVIESALREWFEPAVEGHALEVELRTALRRLIASKGKSLNQLAKIHVLKRDLPSLPPTQRKGLVESWRITASADMLGGKPCIRGLRIRVADILEMLALGASRQAILEDYPYLEDGDITAALEYAVASIDHRLIKAA